MSKNDQKEKKQITAAEVVKVTLAFFETVLEKTARVIEVNKASDDWTVVVECLEESDYMRRFGRGDMLGIYEVKVDPNLNVISYTRKELRERSDLS